jgi:hypothetical protein
MLTSDQAVHLLADRVKCPGGTAPERRASLEASLLPMVRCVLRTGRGNPRLVRWVQKTLPAVTGPRPAGQPVDPDREAVPMARLLCAALLQKMRGHTDGARAALETVVGP